MVWVVARGGGTEVAGYLCTARQGPCAPLALSFHDQNDGFQTAVWESRTWGFSTTRSV
jgi:hypothetical protein